MKKNEKRSDTSTQNPGESKTKDKNRIIKEIKESNNPIKKDSKLKK